MLLQCAYEQSYGSYECQTYLDSHCTDPRYRNNEQCYKYNNYKSHCQQQQWWGEQMCYTYNEDRCILGDSIVSDNYCIAYYTSKTNHGLQ